MRCPPSLHCRVHQKANLLAVYRHSETLTKACEQVVIMADGQVTRNTEIVKPNVRKVRTMIDGSVIGGFAGMRQVPSASPDITKASSS